MLIKKSSSFQTNMRSLMLTKGHSEERITPEGSKTLNNHIRRKNKERFGFETGISVVVCTNKRIYL